MSSRSTAVLARTATATFSRRSAARTEKSTCSPRSPRRRFELERNECWETFEKVSPHPFKTSKKIKQLQNHGLKKVFDFYEKELSAETIFSKTKTNRITYGLGDFAFLNYSFKGFLQYDDIFPLQEADFEGIKVYIPNKPEKAITRLYGDYMKLPKDIGISQAIEDTNSYLKSRHKDIIDYRNN